MSIGQPKISRVTVEATSTVYVPEDDVLYVNNTTYPKEAGAVEAGSPLPLSYKTKDFDFGDLNESTVLMGLEADIKSTDVTVKRTLRSQVISRPGISGLRRIMVILEIQLRQRLTHTG